jgi:hypothetical protein
MSRTTQNAKHLIKVNYLGVADKIKQFRKPRRATKARK